jgi:hypothetical protein
MALADFWTNVRIGAGLVGHRVIGDSAHLDSGAIESRLRGATLWLTPRAVDGFDKGDFTFLPDDERERMARLVADFHDEAEKVNPSASAPTDVVESALPLFLDLVGMLGFDRFEDPEAYRLGKQIEREVFADRPSELAQLRFNTGIDHTGDPALWVWALLTEDTSKSDEEFLKAARRLEKVINPIARRVAPDRWPYISFRPIKEPAETEAEPVP